MASTQCSKLDEQTCKQGNQHSSLGHKLSEMTSRVFNKHQGHQTAGYAKAEETRCCSNKSEHKKGGLFQKIRGGTSHDSGSSNSDSKSDHEKRGNKKASVIINSPNSSRLSHHLLHDYANLHYSI
ncbi:hypothetical protein CFOL_v3_09301 [Cephalotus follicularis]|uniref:Uncharacterized protein n=1 Tax=Cephalotus follicularis TaxID=3775 RepID=A0A1Q3BCM3_CEPFO|nr:hypothetical protein CFOL_v3_09301 [Cephalotus follicularis]